MKIERERIASINNSARARELFFFVALALLMLFLYTQFLIILQHTHTRSISGVCCCFCPFRSFFHLRVHFYIFLAFFRYNIVAGTVFDIYKLVQISFCVLLCSSARENNLSLSHAPLSLHYTSRVYTHVQFNITIFLLLRCQEYCFNSFT